MLNINIYRIINYQIHSLLFSEFFLYEPHNPFKLPPVVSHTHKTSLDFTQSPKILQS